MKETGHLEELGIANEFFTVRAMVAYRVSSGKVPFILIFSNYDLTAVKKSAGTHWRWGLVGPWAGLDVLEKINLLSYAGNWALDCPACTLFTVLTTLSCPFLSVGGRVWAELVCNAYKMFIVCCFTEENVSCICTCFIHSSTLSLLLWQFIFTCFTVKGVG